MIRIASVDIEKWYRKKYLVYLQLVFQARTCKDRQDGGEKKNHPSFL